MLPYRLVYHERYDLNLGEHVFPSKKFRWLHDRLIRTKFASPEDFVEPEPATDEHVVPYCIEPMESMPDDIRALIDAQFRCAAGTHLKRDSRPVWVVPSGEEALGRPFVLRFKPQEKANAWYVRGYTTEH